MKKLIFSAIIGAFLSINLFAQQTSLLRELLDLPAQPPFSVPDDVELDSDDGQNTPRSEEFYNKENVPPDDAPIADLIDFWARQNFITAEHPNQFG